MTLGNVRPGAHRSWWLREALAADPGQPCPPLAGSAHADIAIVGGGYTGLWSALRILDVAPLARIVVLERDICGGGPSGRNGGFVTGCWDEIETLIERSGPERALAGARAVAAAVDEIGAWCEAHGLEAWFRRSGYVQASGSPAQDDAWRPAVEACRRLGVDSELIELSADEVALRVRSPVLRAGAFMPAAATVQPARLARGLRRVALQRGVRIFEDTRVTAIDGSSPGLIGTWLLGERRRVGGVGRPIRVETSSAAGTGEVIAERVIVAVNAWAAAWPWFGPRLVTWSSYIVITEPIPDRLAEIGWTGGEGLCDARFTLHYLRTTPDGRIAIGGGGGRAGVGGRIGRTFTHDVSAAERAASGLRRLFPSLADVRVEDAWGGPIDISSDHQPFFGTLPGGRVHFGHGYSGNGVAPSLVGGKILAALALDRRDDQILDLPFVDVRPRAFPPEPFRSVGARIVRDALVRREAAEDDGRRPGRLARELTRLPTRMGYHLGRSD
jgi:glycine/D-amino acid oxidase-like deaminating enzyme